MPTFQKTPMSQAVQIHLTLLQLTQQSPQGLTQNTIAGDSPVAPREKATNPYVNPTGSLTPLFQLKRRVDLHASTRDEA